MSFKTNLANTMAAEISGTIASCRFRGIKKIVLHVNNFAGFKAAHKDVDLLSSRRPKTKHNRKSQLGMEKWIIQ